MVAYASICIILAMIKLTLDILIRFISIGRCDLSTRHLELYDGEMLRNMSAVFERAASLTAR